MAPLEEHHQPQAQTARPTMISAKYRQKEERRKLLKLSVAKLRRIEDPESALRRSVLINNTVRRLQREAKPASDPAPLCPREDDWLEAPLPPSALQQQPPLEPVESLEPAALAQGAVLDELEDVLSQFYMPPTPRMITSIDEDDDLDPELSCSSPSSSYSSAAASSSCSPCRRPSSGPRPPSKRARFERQQHQQDRLDEEEARALADPTNTLEDFKDDVYLRSKPLPRTPLSSANAASGEEAIRSELCSRRFTGHDRENIAPLLDVTGAGALAQAQGQVMAAAMAAAAAAGSGSAGTAPSPQVQPYSCGQAHGQASMQMQAGLVFHGFMASMES